MTPLTLVWEPNPLIPESAATFTAEGRRYLVAPASGEWFATVRDGAAAAFGRTPGLDFVTCPTRALALAAATRHAATGRWEP